MEKYTEITNPNLERKVWRKKILRCSFCPPNRAENIKRNCKISKRNVCWKLRKKLRYAETKTQGKIIDN